MIFGISMQIMFKINFIPVENQRIINNMPLPFTLVVYELDDNDDVLMNLLLLSTFLEFFVRKKGFQYKIIFPMVYNMMGFEEFHF